MLFLLGAKAHPAIRVLLGLATVVIGLILGAKVIALLGIPMLAWGGYTWFQRSRAAARQREADLRKSGAVR
jgi:hypothetical protein